MKTKHITNSTIFGLAGLMALTLVAQGQDTGRKKIRAKAEKYADSVPQPTMSGIRYGDHARHVLDFWKAESEGQTPLVFVIHGGGWRSGSKV